MNLHYSGDGSSIALFVNLVHFSLSTCVRPNVLDGLCQFSVLEPFSAYLHTLSLNVATHSKQFMSVPIVGCVQYNYAV